MGWYASRAAFLQAHPPPVELARHGRRRGAADRASAPRRRRVVLPTASRWRGGELRARREGEAYVEVEDGGRRSRIAVSWHAPLAEVVRRRVRFILEHQRASHRAGAGAPARCCPSTSSRGSRCSPRAGRTSPTRASGSGWACCCRRRCAAAASTTRRRPRRRSPPTGASSPSCVAHATTTGCARTPTGATRARGSTTSRGWSCCSPSHDPDRALEVLRGYYRRGGERFLAIGAGIAARDARRRAARPRGATRTPPRSPGCCAATRGARVEAGGELPAHEVNYEQSMVAPLLEILCARPRARPATSALDDAIAARLPWLLAFGGPQPHVRLRDIAIRHWDGYWFGREQLWGDTFPHHWSALTANVLLMLPAAAPRRRRARARRDGRGARGADLRRQPDRLRPRRHGDGGVRDARAASPAGRRTAPTRSPTTRTGRSTGRCLGASGADALDAGLGLERARRRTPPAAG